ncbi:hypothetical protein [Alicyclobacillus macrosporangiidus]|uniref:hypothetical protein n=1 Tax=Alicyclobacillus macrosporangiidus TaxID=392015 RepID=UPI0004985372|nr:hypothetical protein [Alicyclobacillus macrosporangiidus]
MDITPAVGTPIGGNVRSDNRSRFVHDPLFANILYLRHENQELLFINCDLLALERDWVHRLKERVLEFTGLPPECQIVTATHTHSGPDVGSSMKDDYDPMVVRYLESFVEDVARGACKAMEEAEDSTLWVGRSQEDSIAFNRRVWLRDGSLHMNWEGLDPEQVTRTAGPIDPEVLVWQVRHRGGRVRCVLVNYTLHPAVLVGKDWAFSRDYIHDLNVYLQQQLGSDVVVLFVNGALGNINHINVKNPNQTRGFEETERIGRILGEAVMRALANARVEYEPVLHTRMKVVSLPRRVISDEELAWARDTWEACGGVIPSLLDGIPDEAYARELLAMASKHKAYIATDLQVVRVGDSLVFCLPGEFFVEFGLHLKHQVQRQGLAKHTFVFGLANDCVGYVPTQEAFAQGGYEVRTCRHSQLAPEAGDIAVRALLNMASSLR